MTPSVRHVAIVRAALAYARADPGIDPVRLAAELVAAGAVGSRSYDAEWSAAVRDWLTPRRARGERPAR